jgi:hypothetical protein
MYARMHARLRETSRVSHFSGNDDVITSMHTVVYRYQCDGWVLRRAIRRRIPSGNCV